MDILHHAFSITCSLAQTDKECVARILGDDIINLYILNDSTINALDGQSRTEGIKHSNTIDADMTEATIRGCTELNSRGATANLTVADSNTVVAAFWVIRLQANTIVSTIHLTTLYQHLFAIS